MKLPRTWKRAGAMLALAAIIGCIMVPVVSLADGWYGSFVRDSSYYLDVNCKAGCTGSSPTQTNPAYQRIEDAATTANVANVETNNASSLNASQGVDTNDHLYAYQGGIGYNRLGDCGAWAGGTYGALCATGFQNRYDLALNVAAAANQTWTATDNAMPRMSTLCLKASAATTFTILESIDKGSNYYAATSFSGTAITYAPASAGSQCFTLGPANGISVQTSAAVTVSAQWEVKG